MAIDPAVQAALEVLSTSHYLSMDLKRAELVVAAVTPLIRAQAFTEAADAIEVQRDAQKWSIIADAYTGCADLVRGLSEGTDA